MSRLRANQFRLALAGMLASGLLQMSLLAENPKPRVQPKTMSWSVSSTENSEALIGILGQIQRPGTYRCRPGMTLQELIFQAGGLTAAASPSVRVVGRK
ncbi:MAG: SLBB domain-containing protein [Planctomycetaceae bacterium]